jgi:hypothetical protein
VADGSGARPESARESGLPMAGGNGPGCGERWGGSGAREEGSERSGDGWTSGAARTGSERLGDSGAEGERGGKRWGSGRGGATRRGGAVGPGPDQRTAPGSGPSTALMGDVRHVSVCRPDREGERGS